MIYVIPAFGDTGKEKHYQVAPKYKVLNLQVKKGVKFSDLVNKAVKILTPNDTVFGFSMGALIAYCAVSKVPVKKAVIASISPYLDKDYLIIRKPYPIAFDRQFGEIFINSIKNIKYTKSIAKEIFFLYGEEEHILLIKRVKKLSKNKATEIKRTGHELNKRYIKSITKIMSH